MKVMNDFVLDMFDKLATEAKNDLQLNQAGGGGRSTTMLPKHFNTATKLILPGELAKHGLSEGSRAVLMHKTWSANSGGKK
jgi:histone H2B